MNNVSNRDPILESLKEIIRTKNIRILFQPIISLKDGVLLGYEALTEGPEGNILENSTKLFSVARKYGLVSDVENICRKNTLLKTEGIKEKQKLFINIDPDTLFNQGFLRKFKDNFDDLVLFSKKNIVIELTEKLAVKDQELFKTLLDFYTGQGCKIAIDNLGAELNARTISSACYGYIKVDQCLIHGIDNDQLKLSLLEGIVKFAQKIDLKVIAEGIESEEELKILIDIGIDYGQGHFIAEPAENLVSDLDISQYINNNSVKNNSLVGVVIGELVKRQVSVSLDTKTNKVVEMFEGNDDLQEIVVLEDEMPVGLLMKNKIFSRLGTRYGYSVFIDRSVNLIMDKNPLIIDANTAIEKVSAEAMIRDVDNVYDCIIVTKDDKYLGVVSIKNLLDKFSKLKIEHAKNLNPLTNLPGNMMIEREVTERISNDKVFSVLYIDLDNFKAYNDYYGYKKGDEVIGYTAELLKEVVMHVGNKGDFVGHIGGDDFVIVTDPQKDELISQSIIDIFDLEIKKFFNEKDRKQGYIMTKNRQGNICKTPLVSISIAIVSNKDREICSHLKVSDIAAEVKKRVKKMDGSNYQLDLRRS
ncbi:diguanylate cyclase/phosphodiesterase [Orenia metallireducens]|uniref:Diguanylate cyclase/phosphodiesterase n=1 Tax=Orenia metallireducens TaxID=1413210 RepID=A0A285GWC6_9FIRM|nr:EAL domain-containing protein [Orenia metallireducens]SNY27812.1 diguanylate cyclase/phosphodiesterase [Orenia metallireducens]